MFSLVKKWAALGALAVLVACGGGGGGGTPTPVATVITAQPTSVSVYETEAASFSVAASGSGSLSYQWKKNGAAISGATASTYTIASSALTDGGSVSVDVTGAGGTTSSATATLSVQAAGPVITTQPTAQSVIVSDTATFSVAATGLPTLSYEWYKVPASGSATTATTPSAGLGAGGVSLPAGAVRITGASGSSYTTTTVTESDNGAQFFAVVSNGKGTQIASDVSVLTVKPLLFSDLVISEVSTCYYSSDYPPVDCWFEIYNPTASAINVSAYAVNTTAYPSGLARTFAMPNVSIPALGHAIVSGNIDNRAQINAQNIRIGSSTIRPQWGANGFVELLKASATVDFVAFGTSAQTPVTPGKWTGSPVAALPSSAKDYGKAIVRPWPIAPAALSVLKSASAADWVAVNFATPAGRNDVPANAVDADGDGIPDSAEVSGGTFAGLDLYAMGARSGQKNLFVEVDYMNSTDTGIVPQKAALQKVADVFQKHSVYVHFDAGTTFSASFSPANFNLGQTVTKVAYEKCVGFDQSTCFANVSSRRSVYDWKDEYMDLRRRAIFHYLLLGNSQLASGAGSGSSGRAEYIGNDLIVTLGSLNVPGSYRQNVYTNYQAATIMHELGHNLGLNHGGLDETNYKPNYLSVMNYLYSLNGLDPDPTSATAYQRWRYEKGDRTVNGLTNNVCGLVASYCGSPDQFVIDFSNGTGIDLDENALEESKNMGRGGSSYADWNMSESRTLGFVSVDLDGSSTRSVLKDYNDWDNLVFPFARYYESNNSGAPVKPRAAAQTVLNPVASDRQAVITEEPPPAAFFEQLRRLR